MIGRGRDNIRAFDLFNINLKPNSNDNYFINNRSGVPCLELHRGNQFLNPKPEKKMKAELTFKVTVEIPDEYRDEALEENNRVFLLLDVAARSGVIVDILKHDQPAAILTEITEL